MYSSLRATAVCLAALAGHTQELRPVFEAAEVRVSDPPTANTGPVTPRLGYLRGSRYEFDNATLVDLIGAAWNVDRERVMGGPAWIDRIRFGVVARFPPGQNRDSVRLMLQSLLIDRFHLAVRQGTRPFAQYVLTAGRHLHLKRPAGVGESGCRLLSSTAPIRAIACRNMTMAQLASQLPRIAGDYFMDNPIADQTGLEAACDFELNWSGRGGLAAAGANGASIFTALESQLGLRVVIRNVPASVIIVDSVQEDAGSNPSGASQRLSVPDPEFEVASIKPSAQETGERSFRIEGSLVTLRGFTLRALIKFAWGLQDMDVIDNDDLLAATPLLAGSQRFDIVARRPASVPGGPADLDAIHQALRALLAERFKLVTHTENRSVTVYAVTPAKLKLRKADPSARSGCRNSLLNPASNVAATPLFSVSCRNTTMAQLAERLQPWAGAYLRHPVIDATGLAGGWDFVVQWSPPHLVSPAAADAEGGARDPNADLTLTEALDRQLGLKLRLEKRSVPVLMVDHIESRPLEN
jgi:uncharacterized protein (TIGR03435 family)